MQDTKKKGTGGTGSHFVFMAGLVNSSERTLKTGGEERDKRLPNLVRLSLCENLNQKWNETQRVGVLLSIREPSPARTTWIVRYFQRYYTDGIRPSQEDELRTDLIAIFSGLWNVL